MVKQILTAIIFLVTIACNQKTDKVDCSPYFIFDQVEHYSISISEEVVMSLHKKEKKTKRENKLLDLLSGDKPDTLSDTTLFRNIERLGFKKQEIHKDKFGQLNEIFCERKHEEAMYSLCIAIYRDILIFKRQNKTVGFARICFDCGDSIIAGTDKDWGEFGQSGDFSRLGAILANSAAEK